MTVNHENLEILKLCMEPFQIVHSFVKVNQTIYKNANKNTSMKANQILLSCDRLKLSQ